MPATWSPRASSCRATSQPIKPAVPVTRIRIVSASLSESTVHRVGGQQVFDIENHRVRPGQGTDRIDAHGPELVVGHGDDHRVVVAAGRLGNGADTQLV